MLPAKPDLNIVSPTNLLNPLPLYRHLQESEPVYWAPELQSWLITRHEDVTALFRDPRMSANRMRIFVEHQLKGVGADSIKDLLHIAEQQMLNRDGAEHARLRRNANPGFTPQALEGWRSTIRQTTDLLLDEVQQARCMDLVPDFTELLPARIIMDLFAIPARDRQRFQQWSSDAVRLFGITTRDDVREVARKTNAANAHLFEYLKGFIAERRARPGPDMFSTMIHAHEGGRLDEDELVSNVLLIVVAGHVTTVDQLANGVHALLTHPEQLRKLQEDPSLIKSAVEEMMRFGPAVPFIHRIATEDLELRGQTIKRGQVVFLGMAAANRDPSVFPEPDRFDITRQGNKHLAFAFGPHSCIGATLARYDMEFGVGRLLDRMKGLRLDEERPARLKCHSLVFRGFESLPVRWDA
ncbi:MAG TPA: cytochrome P450 [Myxococcaceae bacterium]|nr:cytochrome P450 [Myxococcaceae bacterium]